MRSALCLRFSSWSTSAKIPRSILKDVFHKYRKVCDRKNVRRIRYPTVLLCGSFVFSPDRSVTQISPPETVSPKEVPAVRLWLVSWLDTVLVLVHCVRTLLVFTPLLLLSPLALLPAPLRPSSLLLELLVWTLQTAGPAYIKLSQWASTRHDLFPASVCRSLSRLQTQTNPHSWQETSVLLEQEWGRDWEEKVTLERKVVASGCCGQVYRGQLREGRQVAVKVVHPHLASSIHLDLALMRAVASTLTRLLPGLEWLNLSAAVGEFESLLQSQVDLRTEASNLLNFRQNFSDEAEVCFPEPVLSLCGETVLVEDWMEGESIQDYLLHPDTKLKARLAKVGVSMLLKMVFADNYWHGDLHPGNLLVTESGKLCVLDAGIAASLSTADRENIVLTFRAIVTGDGARVGELFLDRSHHECQSREAFIGEIKEIVDKARAAQLSLDRIDVPSLLQSVFSTLIRHKVRLDANFSSVIISIAVVEGLGRALDPTLDLIPTALPYIMKT